MPDTVGVFNDAAQLDALLAWQSASGAALDLIALGAQADYAAERRGVAHRTIEDFYDEGELHAEGIANFPRLDALCRRFDERFAHHVRDLPDAATLTGLLSAFQYFYSLKLLYDSVLHRGFSLDRLLRERRPARVIGFAAPSRPVGDDIALHQSPSLALDLLPILTRARGIGHVALPYPSPVPAPPPPPPPAPPSAWPEIWEQIRRIKAGGHVIGNSVLLGPYWSDIDPIRVLQGRGIPVLPLSRLLCEEEAPPAPPDAVIRGLWDDLRDDDAHRALTTVGGVDLSALVEPRWRHFVTVIVPRHLRLAQLAAERFALLERCILLSSFPISTLAVAAGSGVRAAGGVDVVVQHGGFLGYMVYPLLRYGDGVQASRYLCYGPGGVETVATLDPPPSRTGWPRRCADVDPTGSAAIQALHRRLRAPPPARAPERGVRVLYVGNSLIGDERYFSWHAVPEVAYARSQRALIARCATLDGVELTVRPSPSDPHNPLRSWLEDRGPRCRVAWSTPFTDLIGDADLILIDAPSTTLLQALASSARVVVHADRSLFKFVPGARGLLERRAAVATDWPGFLAAIDEAIAAVRRGDDPPLDDGFLFHYAVPAQGDAAERTADAVLRAPGRS